LPIPSHQQANTRLTAIPPCQHRARREPWSGDPGRAPEARALNQARPLPETWWLVTELNRGPRYARFSRTGVACTVSTGFSDQHSTVEFTSPILLFAQDFACRLPLGIASLTPAKRLNLAGRAGFEPAHSVSNSHVPFQLGYRPKTRGPRRAVFLRGGVEIPP